MELKKLSLHELNRDLPEDYKTKPKINLFFVADHIRSGHNIGSLFRIADSFSFAKIYICGYKIDLYHSEVRKVALGAQETVEWEFFDSITDCIEYLRSQNIKIIGVEQTNKSTSLDKIELSRDTAYALVMGNEINGISQAALPLIDQFIEIPQWGTKHSLNVSVAAGIVAWEFVKQKKSSI